TVDIDPLRYADMVPVDDPHGVAGKLTESISQFIVGLVGLGKFTRAAKLDPILGRKGPIVFPAPAGMNRTRPRRGRW
ncbi:hypothetical protein, partial [Immundisolibacter sp.]|uniref:hypothetical protein n=1 Tax=Immundisolibacter sp. TaxID=1934948 RepID=UPI003F86FA92